MSEIRKNDEHWRDNLIGYTFDKRLETAITQRHSQELEFERAKAKVQEYMQTGKINIHQNISEGSFVTVTDHSSKILDIGFNRVDDLILDNFGTWLAGLIRTPTTGVTSISLTDITNSSVTIFDYAGNITNTYTFNNTNNMAYSIGTQIQVGSGSTAAVRTNYAIETPFGTAPESTRFGTSQGIYGGGSVSFSGAASAGGNGTVNEMGFFAYWITNTGAYKTIMFFHDILSSGVAFVAGNTINASYSITL